MNRCMFFYLVWVAYLNDLQEGLSPNLLLGVLRDILSHTIPFIYIKVWIDSKNGGVCGLNQINIFESLTEVK